MNPLIIQEEQNFDYYTELNKFKQTDNEIFGIF